MPSDIKSSGNQLYIKFESSSIYHGKGFAAYFMKGKKQLKKPKKVSLKIRIPNQLQVSKILLCCKFITNIQYFIILKEFM